MTLPTFVVIGAMKAGTVSLRHYLDEHPDVFLGRGGKFGEPNFFIAEDNWPRGRGWYESLFDGAGRAAAIGECSPSYTMAPAFGGVPERMAQVVPDARLVYVVRDPIARMQSMYMHQVSAGRERRRAEVALLDDRYLEPSLYGFQLAVFLDHFDRSQVLVIASEVLRDRPREALSAVFDHLAVDPAAADLDRRRQDHRSIDKPVPRLHDLEWLPRGAGGSGLQVSGGQARAVHVERRGVMFVGDLPARGRPAEPDGGPEPQVHLLAVRLRSGHVGEAMAERDVTAHLDDRLARPKLTMSGAQW